METKQDKEEVIKIPKKRGRRPKGGKILNVENEQRQNIEQVNNIILHLNCVLNYEDKSKIDTHNFKEPQFHTIEPVEQNVNNDELSYKLKELQHKLKQNKHSCGKSACFWCTYDFENTPIHIPKNKMNDIYQVYGCFCSPECAAAYLMKEQIDTSTLYERYLLLNHLYAKIYDYTKNIKPAPDPYITLDKYQGNLTIQDYRKLLNNNRLLFTVEYPLTLVLPELINENDEEYSEISNTSSSIYKVKKSSKVSKSNIVNKNFS